ncbi:GSCFA domain-containing protein [Methylobacterium sp. WL19]|uniref:GSCFA domain-containing protein n=1 Tax=Methylobacterium sp. WL19 TaxID=2603896 RepID=UPI0011CA88FA|nr:GSCFA domain-containing protein [Methylobacterium sp. WL19]TXN26880.1 GSCFA domain-containing protein [Methylobacterium sp. WL19]
MLELVSDGVARKISASYSNRPSLYPDNNSLEKDYVVDRYLTKGFMPAVPFVARDTPIVAFGSCFAINISNYLDARGYNVLTKKDNKAYVTKMGDGIVHTSAIRQQFEWAWENVFPTEAMWEGYNHEEFGYSEEARLATKALFDAAEVFIITLGLSEIWYDEPTGEVFWRAPPKAKLDPARHKFRVASFAETKMNICNIRALIAKYNPNAKVVITVSPIPLAASFRPISCLSANAASKSIIRAAVDEFYRETKDGDENLYYFPSYDIVLYAFDNQFIPDRRHINGPVLDFNMKIFERYFCTPGIDDAELLASFRAAQAKDKDVAKNGQQSFVDYQKEKQNRREKALAERKAARLAVKAERRAAQIEARRALPPTAEHLERLAKRREQKASAKSVS